MREDSLNPHAQALGKLKSQRKAEAARANGALGGRPKQVVTPAVLELLVYRAELRKIVRAMRRAKHWDTWKLEEPLRQMINICDESKCPHACKLFERVMDFLRKQKEKTIGNIG